MTDAYLPRRAGRSLFVPLRGLDYHLTVWGDASMATPERPPLLLCHGYMDVGASFQFMVDALAALEGQTRWVLALDWRGYGHTRVPPTDHYWFPDYLADLDALLDGRLDGLDARAQPIDLLGHSMGGNVVMHYAGVRPTRIRRLVNLEGFGLPRSEPDEAPRRLAKWLDELAEAAPLRSYDSAEAVAARLRQTNPRLPEDKAAWLARQWAQPDAAGRWHILGDPAHKRINPLLYRVEEVLAAWRRISAPVLWVDGDLTDLSLWWGQRYSLAEFDQRIAVVPQLRRERLSPCGHMLHHEQPTALAGLLRDFLG
ncbi:alpha/beta fold hydrolase [Ideonella alba]|uniref:Alpha/beta hydrolase n=1 Tax=Ideonella alba TaxID=2824118 RepID=A0A940YLV5_9BURK|nr:alpha/beta hydrolase [Ideonella alba]MBQ0932174.1 alpha/beta hydrolase [Ideonella alba]